MGRFSYKQDTRLTSKEMGLFFCLALILSSFFFPSGSAAQSLIYFGDTVNATLSLPGSVHEYVFEANADALVSCPRIFPQLNLRINSR